VIENLRAEWQGPDSRKPAADDAEIEDCDRQTRDCSAVLGLGTG